MNPSESQQKVEDRRFVSDEHPQSRDGNQMGENEELSQQQSCDEEHNGNSEQATNRGVYNNEWKIVADENLINQLLLQLILEKLNKEQEDRIRKSEAKGQQGIKRNDAHRSRRRRTPKSKKTETFDSDDNCKEHNHHRLFSNVQQWLNNENLNTKNESANLAEHQPCLPFFYSQLPPELLSPTKLRRSGNSLCQKN